MTLIYESRNFKIETPHQPLVDRDDGGHIIITPGIAVVNRQQLSAVLAIELMRLTMVAGQAMETVMNAHGVDIGRINYQDNGNWSVFLPEGPHLHIHLYGRARSAKFQRYGQACFFPHKNEWPGYYERFSALRPEDVEGIRMEIERLMKEMRFSDEVWRIGARVVGS